MQDMTWLPDEARDAAKAFHLALWYVDKWGYNAAWRAVRTVVDHARAVRLRVACRGERSVVKALARYTAHMSRRSLADVSSHSSYAAQTELLHVLIVDVDPEELEFR